MAFFTKSEVRAAAKRAQGNRSIESVITESMESYKQADSFDFFLSHSSGDAELVLGLKVLLEDAGKRVYVDWLEDPEMQRSNVSKETAARLRVRMQQSLSLLYVDTGNASNSKWMPWELGYFDGIKPNQIRVVPVTDRPDDKFEGQEYLGLYPTVSKEDLVSRPNANDRLRALARKHPGLFEMPSGISKTFF